MGPGEKTVYLTRYVTLTPDINDPKVPRLEWADPLFRRRLSRLSRMTCQVLHDLAPLDARAKLSFLSFRGEIAQQLKIYDMLVNDGEISPAAFSQSVFNNAPAQASIALTLRSGYTAIYPDTFYSGVLAAVSPLLANEVESTMLIFADEDPPPDYTPLQTEQFSPFAFAAELSCKESPLPVLTKNTTGNEPHFASAASFLAFLMKGQAVKTN